MPADTLHRILDAAHAAPSVGYSQPWDFVLARDPAVRRRFHRHVQAERATFAATLDGAAAERFARIKIDGVRESTLSVVVTYDPERGARPCSGGTRSPTPASTRSAWPSRTSGSPPPRPIPAAARLRDLAGAIP
ncbi:Nitroreductase family protein [Micromonospora matsumotoense]|uniref:Nitroreductase family protein n=1 Tax=Micromonospora matsumotoense TaxID=121616 RepID=A0A1C5AX40_9ACTN|nr:Nitroreductase family protein [Micromonospora matsumotoense]